MLLEASLQKSNMYKAKVIKPLSPLSSLDPDWIVRLLESSDKESEEQGVEIDWLEKLSPWVYLTTPIPNNCFLKKYLFGEAKIAQNFLELEDHNMFGKLLRSTPNEVIAAFWSEHGLIKLPLVFTCMYLRESIMSIEELNSHTIPLKIS